MASDGEGGIPRRFGERGLESKAAGEIAREAADEGVAGAGGVDGLNLDRSDASRACPCRQQGTAAERVNDRFTSCFTRLRRGEISSSDSTGMSVRSRAQTRWG